MKSILFAFVICMSLVVSSCKKNSQTEVYYMRMNIGNQQNISFSDSLLIASKSSGFPRLHIDAFSKSNGTLKIDLSDSTTGTYIVGIGNPQAQKVIYYFALNKWTTYQNHLFLNMYFVSNVVPKPITLEILEINSLYVQGTFSGTIGDGTFNGTSITNGRFKVRFR